MLPRLAMGLISFSGSVTENRDRIPSRIAWTAGGLVLLGGLITILGWAMPAYRLIDWFDNGISMKTNAALCAAAAGLAIMLLQTRVRSGILIKGLSLFVALVGVLTILEHSLGWDIGIDTLLFEEAHGAAATASPNRMGVMGSTCFFLIGLALWLATSSRNTMRWTARLGMAVLGLSTLPLVGYWYGSSTLYALPRVTGIALQTAIMIFSLGIGLVSTFPAEGLVGALRRQDAGGRVLRSLLFPVLVVPILLGFLRLLGQRLGYYDTAFGTALFALCTVAILLALLWRTAHDLSTADAKIILERTNNELMVKRADQLAAASRMAAVVAHEINNPLASVLNCVFLMQQEKLTPEGRQLLKMTDTELQRIIHITKQTLTFYRAASNHQPVDLQSLLQECKHLVEDELFATLVTIETRGTVSSVAGHPVELRQVFCNLIRNSAEAGSRTVRIRITPDRTKSEGAWGMSVIIADDGPGIRQQSLAHVFEPFYSTKDAKGTGLGLWVAKSIVSKFGGTLKVRTSIRPSSHGTTFVVWLPEAKKDVATGEAASA